MSSGAAGVLLVVDLAAQRVYCANVGHAACLLGSVVGSFNSKQPQGEFLTSEHTLR